ncbi:hypothetical protein H2201_006405 [Coniosporium apollinis]|uniref:DUF803-domain-containing protein n=1 Tax=Coniosporium apollinis TaxID=61459 RepID=A0ABQ9NQD3_9PEZI|nr:hypothetical protein H2201_006405 [Coniosporium apollinis]
MIIPNHQNVAVTAIASAHLPGLGDSEGWSSLIGIVTAIIGNVLISFALNTQRYAHIKLSEERDARRRQRRAGRSRSVGSASYGMQQDQIAEERAKRNLGAKYDAQGVHMMHNEDATETDVLIPKLSSGCSSDSEDTTAQKEQSGPEGRKQSYLKSPYWWIGIVLMTVGEAGNFLAYGFAPASIVSPLGVVALISNCMIAPFMLGERFRKRDLLGVAIAVAGAVTVVLSAKDSNPKLGPDEIWRLIATWEFETYLGITIVCIVGLMVVSKRYGEKSIFIDLGLVGLFGAYTALSTKGVASLLTYTIWRVLTFPVTYLLLAVLIGTAVMQIKYVNRALQRFDATQVIPTQFVLFTLSVILGSAVLYRDFERTTAADAGKFIGGCALTFLGVWFITTARPRHEDENDRAPEDGDAIDLVDDEYEDGSHDSPSRRSGKRPSLPALQHRSASSHARRVSYPRYSRAGEIPTSHDEPSSRLNPSASGPQTTAAVSPPQTPSQSHSTSALLSPLVTNLGAASPHSQPQQPEQQQRSRGAPLLYPTLSAPVLPSEALTLSPRPGTPRNTSELLSPHPPVTPLIPAAADTRGAAAVAPGSASVLRARNSIAGMLPGPLMSPLSASLSAVVADSLRRGVGGGGARRRRRLSEVGRGMSSADEGMEGWARRGVRSDANVLAGDGGEGGLDGELTSDGGDAAATATGSRGRSLSGVLGDVLRGFRRERDAHDEEIAGRRRAGGEE